jgi:hypothetical protein
VPPQLSAFVNDRPNSSAGLSTHCNAGDRLHIHQNRLKHVFWKLLDAKNVLRLHVSDRRSLNPACPPHGGAPIPVIVNVE